MSQLYVNNANPDFTANQVNSVNANNNAPGVQQNPYLPPELVNRVNANNNAPGVQQNPHLPPELQNARPSNSVWATIGRVALVAVRVIGALVSFGISEIIIRKVTAARDAPQPRVPQNRPGMLPPNSPRVNAENNTLASRMNRLDIPQQYRTALEELLGQLSDRYGDIVPQNLDTLRRLWLHNVQDGTKEPFTVRLQALVRNSSETVDPARLQSLAKELLEPEIQQLAVGTVLQQKAQEFGIELRPEGIQLATTMFFQDCAKMVDGRPMGPVTDSLQPFLNFQGMDNTQQITETVNKVAGYVSVEDVLQRAYLRNALETSTLPPTHQTAVDTVVNELRNAFGQDCLPTGMTNILLTKVGNGTQLRDLLKSMTKKALTPQDVAQTVKDKLTPLAQHHAMSQVLGGILETEHGIKLHPKVLPTLLNALKSTCPALQDALPRVGNTQQAQQAMDAQKATVGAFLTTVANNIKAMEETYLPQVKPELKPVLQNFIRSLPFDAANKAGSQAKPGSQAKVQQLAADMATWQASIPLDDPNTKAFCDKMVSELNIRTQTLAGEDTKFTGNIHNTFLSDCSRGSWKLNGEEFTMQPQKTVVAAFQQLVPTAIDQQFLSKLTNQYLWSSLENPLKGVQVLNPNDLQKPDTQFGWQYSGDLVKGEERQNGLSFYTGRPGLAVDLFQQPQNVGIPNDGYFSINVSEDKKTAVVEMALPKDISTDTYIPVGTCKHIMRVHCDLSGGDPNVRPRVTSVQVSQEIKPLDI